MRFLATTSGMLHLPCSPISKSTLPRTFLVSSCIAFAEAFALPSRTPLYHTDAAVPLDSRHELHYTLHDGFVPFACPRHAGGLPFRSVHPHEQHVRSFPPSKHLARAYQTDLVIPHDAAPRSSSKSGCRKNGAAALPSSVTAETVSREVFRICA